MRQPPEISAAEPTLLLTIRFLAPPAQTKLSSDQRRGVYILASAAAALAFAVLCRSDSALGPCAPFPDPPLCGVPTFKAWWF
jgi:hypothetical protein